MKTQTVTPSKQARSIKDVQAAQIARQAAPSTNEKPEEKPAEVVETEVKSEATAKTEEHDFSKYMFRRSPKKVEEEVEVKTESKPKKGNPVDFKPSKEEKPETEAKTEEVATEKAEEKAESKKTLKPKPAKEPVDLEKLVSSAVKATAEALRPEKAESKTETAPAKQEVPRRRSKEFDAIARAEESGIAHKGSAAAAAEAFRAEDEYIKKWESDNGRKFNSKDSDHDHWYDRNLPDWIEEAAEAGDQLSQQDRLKKSLSDEFEKTHVGPLRQELEQLRMKEHQREVEVRLPQSVNMAIGQVIHAINPDLLKEGVKINEADPLAHEILTSLAPKIAEETRAAHMQFATQGKAFPAGDALGDRIIATAYEIDAELQQRSAEELTDPNGKTFVPLDRFAAMTPAQQKAHWSVNADIVSMKLASNAAQKAKSDYQSETEKLDRLASSRGWVKKDMARTTETKSDETEREEPGSNEKPRSPSTASTTVIKPGAKAEVKVVSSPFDHLHNGLFRR